MNTFSNFDRLDDSSFKELEQKWKSGNPLTAAEREIIKSGNGRSINSSYPKAPQTTTAKYKCQTCGKSFSASLGTQCPYCGSTNVLKNIFQYEEDDSKNELKTINAERVYNSPAMY